MASEVYNLKQNYILFWVVSLNGFLASNSLPSFNLSLCTVKVRSEAQH
jgi:hypothetical protein